MKKEKEEAVEKKGKSAKTFTVPFILKNDTKGAVRFQETDSEGEPLGAMDDGAIGTLYVRKAFLEEHGVKNPSGCDITLTFRK